jgi:hypothetical protein
MAALRVVAARLGDVAAVGGIERAIGAMKAVWPSSHVTVIVEGLQAHLRTMRRKN